MKLAVIAGRGDLPKHVVAAARENSQLKSIIALEGFANLSDYPNAKSYRVGEFGRIVKYLKKEEVTHVCFCGNVDRPDFSKIKPDLKAMFYLPGTIKAASKGDDALLRHLLGLFEKEGFQYVSPQDVCAPLLMPEGTLGDISLNDIHRADALSACHIAQSIGALDIGQGAVVARGVTLAVEAQEGTDAMLLRVATLPQALRGSAANRVGVLAKMVKPTQDTRIDLPVIGLKTLQHAANAGLAGVVAEAGGAFFLDKAATIDFANANGLFILGLPAKLES
ncbi:hypothetical protein DES40_0950 [Litorimonas taeanensis]|uniref:Phosphatidate cytidylyltransferase n=2 Tax=Litorimonas taeanensis TaxID=568099 RepID=A0A420WKS7_9PROT|nr:hypothetical protein DES40_0950 [Litorimonas taeanensis]